MSAKAHSSSFISVKEAFHHLQSTRPDSHLDSNILKLCQGLRKQGLTNYAETLEDRFLQYKQANALYDVSGETGEDVVNQAHPDGSHAMENVEGDATIETILERSKKIQQVVNKMPTGKLASKDALNVIRILLAQTQPDHFNTVIDSIKSDVEAAVNSMDAKLGQILVVASTAHRSDLGTFTNLLTGIATGPIGWITGAIEEYFKTHKNQLKTLKDKLDSAKKTFDKDPSQENLQDIKSTIDSIQSEVDDMPADSHLDPLKKEFDGVAVSAQKLLDQAMSKYGNLSTSTTTTTTVPAQAAALSPAEQKRQALITKVNGSTKMTDDNKKKAFDWLNAQKSRLADPQTATQTSTYIDQLEKQLTDQGFIS